MKRLSRNLSIVFTEDTTTPAHWPTYQVSVQENGREVEAGELTGMAQADWKTLTETYLRHRLCQSCPGSTSASQPASSTPASRPAARKTHRPK